MIRLLIDAMIDPRGASDATFMAHHKNAIGCSRLLRAREENGT